MAHVLKLRPGGALERALPVASSDELADLTAEVGPILEPSISRLFSVTLTLAAMASTEDDARAAHRLLGAVHEIDEAIRQIRDDLIEEVIASRCACDGEHHSW